jgi:hypothetical protein
VAAAKRRIDASKTGNAANKAKLAADIGSMIVFGLADLDLFTAT